MARSILITGGGSGIGRATAQLFAARGWRVGLADVDAAGLAATAALLPAGAETYVMDVRDRDGWAATLAAFAGGSASGGGAIDVLFNNAGVPAGGPLAETSAAEIDRVIAINLTGVIDGARLAYPYLAKSDAACLLNMASAAGIYGGPSVSIYAATKAAVVSLSQTLDAEWAPVGIRVRALMPSFIETPLLDAVVSDRNTTVRERVRAAGLELTPVEEVAAAAWAAVHGERLLSPVGATARRLAFAARWFPGRLRAQMRRSAGR